MKLHNNALGRQSSPRNITLIILSAILLFITVFESQRIAYQIFLDSDVVGDDSLQDQGRSKNMHPSHIHLHPDTSSISSNRSSLPYPREIWAGGYKDSPFSQSMRDQIRAVLGQEAVQNLSALCSRVMYETLTHSVTSHGLDDWTFVSTGDIKEMWIRDSAIQMQIFLPYIHRRPALRRLIEGTLRAQAYMIIQDPYANSYSPEWVPPEKKTRAERILGRGGWVGTRNYELDSGAYFMHYVYNYYATPDLYKPENLVGDPLIYDAVSVLVDIWTVEQNHERQSTYRYAELERDGLGSPTGYTGMTWSGFRPSDDPTEYGYNVPGNIYAAAALQRVLELNSRVWRSPDLHRRTTALLEGITQGIRKYGVVDAEVKATTSTVQGDGMPYTSPNNNEAGSSLSSSSIENRTLENHTDGTDSSNNVKTSSSEQEGGKQTERVYAFEVDGLGHALTSMDDTNLPSLLSIPLLGWDGYDEEIYKTTRSRILSEKYNNFYFKGPTLEGLGSPHTPPLYIWALGVTTRALTTSDPAEASDQLRMLLDMQCGTGSMHESINVNNPSSCTRHVFHWADAAAVVAIEALLNVDCDAGAESIRQQNILLREETEKRVELMSGGPDAFDGLTHFNQSNSLFYESLEAHVARDSPSDALVQAALFPRP